MGRINLLAGAALLGVLALGFLGTEHAALYINGIGLIIVLSGTLAATVLSYPMQDIGAALRVAHNSYVSSPPSDVEIVDAMLDLAVRSRHHGVLALEDAEGAWQRQALLTAISPEAGEELATQLRGLEGR